MVFQQSRDRAGLNPFRNSKGHKSQTVETRQSVVAANPDIAFAVLGQRVNGAFREALFLLPGLKGERPGAVANPRSRSIGPGATHIHKITEGSGDCQIAKIPTTAPPGMPQTNFIKARIRVKTRR